MLGQSFEYSGLPAMLWAPKQMLLLRYKTRDVAAVPSVRLLF